MKQSTIDLIDPQNGNVNVRFCLTDSDDKALVKRHRVIIPPGGNVDAIMALVNADLEKMGWPAIADYQSLKAHAALAAAK